MHSSEIYFQRATEASLEKLVTAPVENFQNHKEITCSFLSSGNTGM
jgi:hypothetical protein